MSYFNGAATVVAVCTGVGGLLVAGVGVGFAAGHQGTINGCVAKSGGAFRIVRTAHSCSSKERSISFNAAGVRGLQGLRGAQGPQGPRGTQGPQGLAAPGPSTFQMYANVDAEGHLGSEVDATSAEIFNGTYIVTFDEPIGHCAMVVQSGKAGGGDTPHADTSVVAPNDLGQSPDPAHQVLVSFAGSNGFADSTPFMLLATCNS